LGEAQVNLGAPGSVTQNLVAKRYGVGVKPTLGVLVDPPLPHLHCSVQIARLLIQIAHLVEKGQLLVQLGLTLQLLEDPKVLLDGLVDLILELETAGFFLGLGYVQGEPLTG
jgi:hypothetical protein